MQHFLLLLLSVWVALGQDYVESSSGADADASKVDCSLPNDVGLCKALIPRFFYNSTTKSCQPFYYGGCGGNTNNFISEEECYAACQPEGPTEKRIAEEDADEKPDCSKDKEAGICRGSLTRFYFNSATNQCEQFIYGGCGGNSNNFQSLEECTEACNPKPDCSLDKAVGNCVGRLPRFYYNSETKKCEMFFYGGCRGNSNNFMTEEECSKACSASSASVASRTLTSNAELDCAAEKEKGNCKAMLSRYFYNSATGECEEFIYGGCGGNTNNFETQRQCNKACKPEPDCSLPKKIGNCMALLHRYYYNTATQKCEQFVYGGCLGNSNNFLTEEECAEVCENGQTMSRSGYSGQSKVEDASAINESTGLVVFLLTSLATAVLLQ